MIYSKKEKTVICTLSILCILCFLLNTVFNVFGQFGVGKKYISLTVHNITNPAYTLWCVLTIILCILFIMTMKGLFKGYRHKKIKRKLFYYISLIVFLILIILFLPNYTPFIDLTLWITVDFIGVIYTFFYMIYIFNPNEG